VYSTRGTLSSPFSTRIAVPQLSSTEVDTAPEISRDGKVAIVARGVGDAREMWIYTRAADGLPTSGWDAGRQLTELSSAFTDTSAELDEKGLTVYFHSNRVGTFDDDLYVATRASTTDPFGAPVVISELQTSDDEGDPTLSADGRILVFHRNLDLMQSRR
jgi:hypothetical protein